MINVVIGLVLYFLMVWGVVDIVQRMWAKHKKSKAEKERRARMQKQTIADVDRIVREVVIKRSHFDYTFSNRGNRFTISAQSTGEAWWRAQQLLGDTNGVYLVEVTGPHMEVKYGR